MKRVCCLAVLAALVLGLSACGGLKLGDVSEYAVNTVPGAHLTIVEATAGSAVYQIANGTGGEIETGNENVVDIEAEQDGVWRRIEVRERAFTAEALIIGNGQTQEMETVWASTYGALPKGHYRLLKGFVSDEAGNFTLAAEFDVG